jgi:DNA-3-methyladenine glycosylase
MTLILKDFYTRSDVVSIARELLGKMLITQFDGKRSSGIITETEAYEGITDRASHAYLGRRSKRTEIMYRVGGTAYVYLCYGVHSLFNIVTNVENIPHAILIRGIIPVDGIDHMLDRTGKKELSKDLSNGPGKLTKALGIHYIHTGLDLTFKPGKNSDSGIWLEDNGFWVNKNEIRVTPRVGVDYAGEDASLPYRFFFQMKKATLVRRLFKI